MSLTVEQILAAKDRPVEEVSVPEWGGSVYVRRLSAFEAIDHVVALRAITGETPGEKARGGLVASLATFLCDENGNSICTIEQAQELARKASGPVNRIITAGHKLNATDDRDVEESAKNSEPSPAATSPTG